ncbi:cytochrome P450 [Sphingomonas sp. G-3-2-10]|uniref:cytochrome P450 n=1 Tax=Sphingomonas sp. G-3-2-10 TaxID=2728838 RepID=UPI00146A58E9|nr:cytochrome P450 [Sphingomonas sp. G-3-2-10]NML04344.1 cytochrome P450 [Sphingomonas sp. G-3-2-10]
MTVEAADWDPNLNKTVEDRAAEYARLRRGCPVALGHDAWGADRFWGMMRYQDIVSVVRNPKTFANGTARLGIRRMPLESDPPEHSQIRRLLNPLFSPRAMAEREPLTRGVAAEYVDAFVNAGGGDAIAAIARPIPTQVLLMWLGQPREDWEQIKAWADAARPQQVLNEAHGQRIHDAEQALWDYSWAMARDRQANPRDPAIDPVTAILSGTLDGGPMPEEHAVGMVRLVLAAGHDSTSQAVGIVLHFLATRPEIQAQLRADRSLILKGAEEILRLNSPVVAMPRTVAEDTEFGGRQLCSGERMMLFWASANRDPEVFEDAERFRLDRTGKPHMVFGNGIHSCAGAPLARQEIVAVVNEMFDRTRGFELAGEPSLQPMQQYGFATLPLRVNR